MYINGYTAELRIRRVLPITRMMPYCIDVNNGALKVSIEMSWIEAILKGLWQIKKTMPLMVCSDFYRFASVDVCRRWSFAWLPTLRAQIFATRKVVVKDYHRQTSTDAWRWSLNAPLRINSRATWLRNLLFRNVLSYVKDVLFDDALLFSEYIIVAYMYTFRGSSM